MALKPHRRYNRADTDISFFLNETAERGLILTFSTMGSGQALDQSQALLTVSANPSGKVPAGILLNDMVDVDQSRYKLNEYKDEVQKGGKVTVAKRGEFLTNRLAPGIAPTTAQVAYLVGSGLISNASTNVTLHPPIGRFTSTVDEDGYAKVELNLPMIHATSVS